MISKKLFLYSASLFFLALVGCNGCVKKKEAAQFADEAALRKELIEMNRRDLQDEKQRIDHYTDSLNWPVKETGTGLRYWIYQSGQGRSAKTGDVASIYFLASLLNGKECYRTDAGSPANFRIGQDNVESGLHEALLLMHVGDKAKVILPSHRAFGITGDSDRIPNNASVVYDIQLLDLN
jgi:peptidylprolyl isomerase